SHLRSPRFPYTTLFRSSLDAGSGVSIGEGGRASRAAPWAAVRGDRAARRTARPRRPERVTMRPRSVCGEGRPQGNKLHRNKQVRSEEHTSELQSREKLV